MAKKKKSRKKKDPSKIRISRGGKSTTLKEFMEENRRRVEQSETMLEEWLDDEL